MKKLFHYFIIFLVVYWCFNNIKGCSVPEVAKAPQIEEQEHFCGDCTEPIEEVTQEEVSIGEREQIAYEYLKNAIIRNEANPRSFKELNKKIESGKSNVIVTIEYSIINDMDKRVNRRCVGVHEYTMDNVLISVDIKDERIL